MTRTDTPRKHHERQSERYSSDTTDEEWAVIAPLLPGPRRWRSQFSKVSARSARQQNSAVIGIDMRGDPYCEIYEPLMHSIICL